jgi:DNA polymerase I-like protein with 3'-5' exonuclease and polymerase domains
MVYNNLPVTTPWDNPRKFDMRNDTMNMVVNDPIQSTNSEILLYKALLTEEIQPKDAWETVDLIHDSLLAYVVKDRFEELATKEIELFLRTDHFPFDYPVTVPLGVEVKVGYNLRDMYEWQPGKGIKKDGEWKPLSSLDEVA